MCAVTFICVIKSLLIFVTVLKLFLSFWNIYWFPVQAKFLYIT